MGAWTSKPPTSYHTHHSHHTSSGKEPWHLQSYFLLKLPLGPVSASGCAGQRWQELAAALGDDPHCRHLECEVSPAVPPATANSCVELAVELVLKEKPDHTAGVTVAVWLLTAQKDLSSDHRDAACGLERACSVPWSKRDQLGSKLPPSLLPLLISKVFLAASGDCRRGNLTTRLQVIASPCFSQPQSSPAVQSTPSKALGFWKMLLPKFGNFLGIVLCSNGEMLLAKANPSTGAAVHHSRLCSGQSWSWCDLGARGPLKNSNA